MPSNQFSKQPQALSGVHGNYLNGGTGDSVVGGSITGAPSAIGANQGIQDAPGDRLVVGMEDALALSKTSIGTLYGGVYQYMQTKAASVTSPAVGKIGFAATTSDPLFVVTPDEAAPIIPRCVYINALTAGYYDFVQIAGKATIRSTTPLTGAGASGASAYAAIDGAARFDVFDSVGANTTFDQVQAMQARYLGITEGATAANSLVIVDMPMRHIEW